jgi:hypothetical protein
VIFRRRASGYYTKLHLRLLDIPTLVVMKPWTTVTIHRCSVREWLCPRIRDLDWIVATEQGDNLERWFRENGKGSYSYSIENSWVGGTLVDKSATFSFTDRSTALMFKLVFGGR